MTDIPNKIKMIRLRRRLSQEKFAKSMGYSRAYIADIETGRAKPSRRMLEAIQRTYDTSIDWMISENRILGLIEFNKKIGISNIIFVYGFTQVKIDSAEQKLKKILSHIKYILVDASSLRSNRQFLEKIFDAKGTMSQLYNERLRPMMLHEEVVLIIKNMSLSRIPRSGYTIRSIFKIMDDAGSRGFLDAIDIVKHGPPKSNLIILDFPSYLEKNMDIFGAYVIPVDVTEF